MPVERPTGVFEVLVQEPTARVEGPSLREMAPVSDRRSNLPPFPRARICRRAPSCGSRCRGSSAAERERVYFGVGIALLAAMAVSLVVRGATLSCRDVAVVTSQPVEARIARAHA